MERECEGNIEERRFVLGEASIWIMKIFVVVVGGGDKLMNTVCLDF